MIDVEPCVSFQASLENSQGEWLEKEINNEKKLTEAEDQISKLKVRTFN